MDIKEEITNFIERKEETGALLITGNWGSGKTHYIKSLAKKLNDAKKEYLCIISLFGIDSVATLAKVVKERYLDADSNGVTRVMRKVGGAVKTAMNTAGEIATIATAGNPIAAGIKTGVSSLLSIDFFDFVAVNNEIGQGKSRRQFVLVFDDLERCKINTVDLLGAINEYCENRNVKTIILAAEDVILKDDKEFKNITLKEDEKKKQIIIKEHQKAVKDYIDFKEKVIFQTIAFNVPYSDIISAMIDEYSQSLEGYKGFLKENSSIIQQVFIESNYNNLRTIKASITKFERVYGLWKQLKLSDEYLHHLLYSFIVDCYEMKLVSDEEENERARLIKRYALKNKAVNKYAHYNEKASSLKSLYPWIVTGEFDKNAVVLEIQEKFTQKLFTDKFKFLNWSIFDLEYETIDKGLNAALDDAYKGNLTMSEWTSLLRCIQVMEYYEMNCVKAVDYIMMKNGIERYICRIRDNVHTETLDNFFIPEADMQSASEKIKPLLRELQYVYESVPVWENREKLLSEWKEENEHSLSNIHSLEMFDDNLFELFKKKYETANNRNKRELEYVLLKINYTIPYVLSDLDKRKAALSVSITNFARLTMFLEELQGKESDQMTKLIVSKFILHVNETVNNLKQTLERLEENQKEG